MKRFLTALLALTVLAIAAGGTPAYSDHNFPAILPYVPETPVIQETMAKGYITYCLDERLQNYPNFPQQAQEVGLAGYNKIGIPAFQVAQGPDCDVSYLAPSDSIFVTNCGGGAAGCNYYWLSQVKVYIRLSLAFGLYNSTIAHEGINYGHTMGQHEQYDDRNFICLPQNTWTVMSCGTYVWVPQVFDILNVYGVVIPDLPSFVGPVASEDFIAFTYNSLRKDGGYGHSGNPKLDNVTKMAIFYQDPGDTNWYFTGHYGPPAPKGGNASYGFWKWQFCIPGRAFGIRPENGLAITYLHATSYVSGQVAPAAVCP